MINFYDCSQWLTHTHCFPPVLSPYRHCHRKPLLQIGKYGKHDYDELLPNLKRLYLVSTYLSGSQGSLFACYMDEYFGTMEHEIDIYFFWLFHQGS
jgi:hypothetical protein